MKKIISLSLALILILSCFTLTGFAAPESKEPVITEDILQAEAAPEDEQLEKINSVLADVITYIYNYATQPQEPAVDLETVLMIASVIVKVVYTVYRYQLQAA